MHSDKASGYKHPKLFVSCNGSDHDNIAFWVVHIKNHAYDLARLSLVMFLVSQDMSGVLMRTCRHYHTPVLENTEMTWLQMKVSDTCSAHAHSNLMFLDQ